MAANAGDILHDAAADLGEKVVRAEQGVLLVCVVVLLRERAGAEVLELLERRVLGQRAVEDLQRPPQGSFRSSGAVYTLPTKTVFSFFGISSPFLGPSASPLSHRPP